MDDDEQKQADSQSEEQLPPTADFAGSVKGPGTQLGQFRIERELGRGGMGVVYLAHDTKLDRPVAIKSLPPEVMDSPQVRSRFKREARLLASLNHPNIATIYDELEEAEGDRYLILEYIDGQTLAQRLSVGAMNVEEVLSIFAQIAEGLEAAHQAGIVHRDLKPANIKIMPDGKVKVLDFGVAKAVSGHALNKQSTVTEPGRVIGTAAYMSPEQARGNPIDVRADIWAYGCCLYKCLTQKAPFEGTTTPDTLAKILESEPDWGALPQSTPQNIRRLLRRCLHKDVRRRLRDIGDARLELEESPAEQMADTAGQPLFSGDPQVRWRQRYGPWCVAACMVLLAVFFYFHDGRIATTEPRAIERYQIHLPTGQPYAFSSFDWQTSIAISPDGRRIAYVGRGSRGNQIFLRELDQWESVLIEGTEDAHSPFFSPDAERLAFFTMNQLKVISLKTQEIRNVCPVLSIASGGCWESENSILFIPSPIGELMRVRLDRPEPQVAFTSEAPRSTEWLHSPKMLPGNKSLLLTVKTVTDPQNPALAVLNLETQKLEQLGVRGTSPHYDRATGRLVFERGGNILSAPFDIGRAKVTGEPELIDTGMISGLTAEFSLSADGKIVYVPSAGDSERKLVWISPPYQEPEVLETGDFAGTFSLSPNEHLLAIARNDSDKNADIHIFDLARGTWDHRLTFSKNTDIMPVWTPDGMRVTYSSHGAHPPNLFWKGLGGAPDSVKVLLEKSEAQFPTGWSPDGMVLAFIHEDSETHFDIWFLHLEENGEVEKVEEFVGTDHAETGAVFSGDGQWIAYQSNESGRFEIYVEPFPPQKNARLTISTDGGTEPVWSRGKDQLRLFYRNGDQMMAVNLLTEPKPQASDPKVLFNGQYNTGVFCAYYDVTSDGRFLMMTLAESESPMQLNVIVNWDQGLAGKSRGEE